MMYCMFKKNKEQKLSMSQLQHCLRRNFGGKSNVDEIVDKFLGNVPAKYLRTEEITSDNVCILLTLIDLFCLCVCVYLQSYDSTPLGLIKASLQSKDTSWHGYFYF